MFGGEWMINGMKGDGTRVENKIKREKIWDGLKRGRRRRADKCVYGKGQ